MQVINRLLYRSGQLLPSHNVLTYAITILKICIVRACSSIVLHNAMLCLHVCNILWVYKIVQPLDMPQTNTNALDNAHE